MAETLPSHHRYAARRMKNARQIGVHKPMPSRRSPPQRSGADDPGVGHHNVETSNPFTVLDGPPPTYGSRTSIVIGRQRPPNSSTCLAVCEDHPRCRADTSDPPSGEVRRQ
jgi:hypothetical protein